MANKKEQLSNDLAKFVEQSQWAKAVQTLQGLIDLEPTNANSYLRMGDYNVKAGNKAAAVKAYYQAADLFVKAGFSVKGIATYKMILRVAPDEKQAAELMRAINSNPAVTGAAPPPPPVQEPAPAPVVAPPPPAPAVAPPPPSPIEMPQPAPAPVIELELEIEPAPVSEKKDINPLFAAFSKDEFGAIVPDMGSWRWNKKCNPRSTGLPLTRPPNDLFGPLSVKKGR